METLTAPTSSPEAASDLFADQSSSAAEQEQSTAQNGDRPLSAGQKEDQNAEQQPKKELSRYERTKRQRAEFQKREAALRTREEQLAQIERERTKPKKPEYTVEELKKYRQGWDEEGKYELVEKADAEIARLEKLEADEKAASRQTLDLPRHGTAEHRARWEAAEQEIRKENPDFMQPGTPLDSMIRKIMQSPYGQAARGHPEGIWAVYAEAQKELLKEENQSLRGKLQQLESEYKRLTGLTSIGGGAPSRVSGGGRVENLNDFSKLSSADMLKHLQGQAGKGGGMPWL